MAKKYSSGTVQTISLATNYTKVIQERMKMDEVEE